MIGRRGSFVIEGGIVVDHRGDVVVVDGKIVAVGADARTAAPSDAVRIDASGALVTPGLVDIHTHLREPGGEAAETIESGTNAAALGGYSAVLAMPNTSPAIDSAAVVTQVQELARAHGRVAVAVAAAITEGRAGERLAPMGELFDLGVRLFTDDGAGVQNSRLMRRALEYAGALRAADGTRATLAQHCEDAALFEGGHMHEGRWSSVLGIPGIPAAAEELMVARDIALSQLTGTPVHFLHLSTAGSVELLRAARSQGAPVTAEVAPHHLTLCDACASSFDPVFKVNPPLRDVADVHAVRRGLGEGLFSAIATDHAPHAPEAKEAPWAEAPPGMLGLQTALCLATRLVRDPLLGSGNQPGDDDSRAAQAGGIVALEEAEAMCFVDVLAAMSWGPARVAGLSAEHGPELVAGRPANLCVFDPTPVWRVEPKKLASRSSNTPYAGMNLVGQVRHTLSGGNWVVENGELV